MPSTAISPPSTTNQDRELKCTIPQKTGGAPPAVYTAAQTYSLLTTYLAGHTAAFNPHSLSTAFHPILAALLQDHLANPSSPTNHSHIFTQTLATLPASQKRTIEAYLQEGSIELAAITTHIGPAQKSILRALFAIAPTQNLPLAQYLYTDPGNTHRRLQALIKKHLVLTTHQNHQTLYYLNPHHFLVQNHFPDPLQNIPPHQKF